MNLETLVERACLESGYNDTDDAAAAEKFARHWDEHIWNAALWKAALVAVDIAVAPATNADHADGIIFLPEIIDRVVAVRNANNQILIAGQEHHYRMDYDAFAASGAPVEFHILAPAWLTWRWSAAVNYLLISGAAADDATPVKVIWLDGAGKRTVTQTTVGALAQLEPASADTVTIVAIYKAISTAAVTVTSAAGENLIPAGEAYSAGASGEYTLTGLVVGETYAVTMGNAVSLQRRLGFGITVLLTADGEFTVEDGYSYVLSGPTDPSPTGPYPTVIITAVVQLPAETVGTLLPAETASPRYQRIRLLPKPTTAFTLKVLGKAKYEPLEFDQQEPALQNCTPALLAYMRGSLKRRGGEIGAAQLEFQEANALLQQVIEIEALQAANNQRFLPDAGYGPDHGLGPMGLT